MLSLAATLSEHDPRRPCTPNERLARSNFNERCCARGDTYTQIFFLFSRARATSNVAYLKAGKHFEDKRREDVIEYKVRRKKEDDME